MPFVICSSSSSIVANANSLSMVRWPCHNMWRLVDDGTNIHTYILKYSACIYIYYIYVHKRFGNTTKNVV